LSWAWETTVTWRVAWYDDALDRMVASLDESKCEAFGEAGDAGDLSRSLILV
jgi:hypothetical protein